jgi:hypothetical protein
MEYGDERTEAHARLAGQNWAHNRASHRQLIDAAAIAEDEPVSFHKLRGIVDPHGELTRAERYRAIGYRRSFDPDIYATGFVRAAASSAEEAMEFRRRRPTVV